MTALVRNYIERDCVRCLVVVECYLRFVAEAFVAVELQCVTSILEELVELLKAFDLNSLNSPCGLYGCVSRRFCIV